MWHHTIGGIFKFCLLWIIYRQTLCPELLVELRPPVLMESGLPPWTVMVAEPEER